MLKDVDVDVDVDDGNYSLLFISGHKLQVVGRCDIVMTLDLQ